MNRCGNLPRRVIASIDEGEPKVNQLSRWLHRFTHPGEIDNRLNPRVQHSFDVPGVAGGSDPQRVSFDLPHGSPAHVGCSLFRRAYFHTFRCMKNRTPRGNIRLPNQTHHDAKPTAASVRFFSKLRTTDAATSSDGCAPAKFRWIFPSLRSRCFSKLSLRTSPGRTSSTSMPNRSNSPRSDSVSPTNACLLAQCSDIDGIPQRPQMLATFTTAGRQPSRAVSKLRVRCG